MLAWAGRARRLLGQLLGAVIFRVLRRAGSTEASTSIVSGSTALALTGFDRFGPRFNRFGFNRFNRFGSNRFDGNQLLIGGGWGGWGWDGWGGASGSTGASEPIIVGDGAPVIINVGVDPGLGDGGGAYSGGCVIHKLNYDSNGKYVGERQIPQC